MREGNGHRFQEGTLRDQIYFNTDEGKFRVIHRGAVVAETFDTEKAAHEKLAELRAQALVSEGVRHFDDHKTG